MNRLQEIEVRLSAITQEIETRGAELAGEQMTEIETEVTALQQEQRSLVEAERRKNVLNTIAQGNPGTVVNAFNPAATSNRTFAKQTTTRQSYAAQDYQSEGGNPLNSLEYRCAFMNYVLRGTPLPAEYRADATTYTTDIGAAIPATILDRIVEKMETTGVMLSLVTRTSYKGGMSIPTSSVKPVATWVAEGATSGKQKKPVDGIVTFNYYKLRCAVAVSLEVDTVALSVFESALLNNIVEAMRIALETAVISGGGAGKPKGILSETPATDQVVQVSAPSYEDLIEAEGALPQAYENGAAWCMSKKTYMQYFGLVDDSGQLIGRVIDKNSLVTLTKSAA